MSGECELCGECGFECKCSKKEKIDWFLENYKREMDRKRDELMAKRVARIKEKAEK